MDGASRKQKRERIQCEPFSPQRFDCVIPQMMGYLLRILLISDEPQTRGLVRNKKNKTTKRSRSVERKE